MADIEEILQYHQRVCAALVKTRHLLKRSRRIAPQHALQQIEDETTVGDPQHVAHCGFRNLPAREGDRLVEKRQPVAHRAVGDAGDQRQRGRFDLDALRFRDPTIMRDELFDRDPSQRETLAARKDRDRNLVDLSRREHEFHVGRRLFEGLQQRVEGVLREHVHFVDDVDLVAPGNRPIAHPLGQIADIVDAGAGRGVHLQHVDMAVIGNREALRALAAGVCRRAPGAVGSDAVEGARQDAGGRGLADPAHAGQDEGVGDPARRNRVRQGAHHRLLPDQLGEGRRSIFAGEDAISRRRSAHCRKPYRGKGDRTNDPSRGSLRLLPSGPDRIGEGPVRRRPPPVTISAVGAARASIACAAEALLTQ